MFETMACSSKLVEPMMIVGLLEARVEAPAETAGMRQRRGQRGQDSGGEEAGETHEGHLFVVGVSPGVSW